MPTAKLKTIAILPTGADRFYNPALDGLRFLAFFIVAFGHVPRYDNLTLHFQVMSWAGVDLFFMLSAFLLTRLAFDEIAKTGQFNIKNFFIRRCLRIWPLYFLALLIGFLILPMTNYLPPYFMDADHLKMLTEIPAALCFLLNFSEAFTTPTLGPTLSSLWSVCMEEQFYLLFPLLVLFAVKARHVGRRIALAIFLALVVTIALRYWLYFIGDPKVSHLMLPARLDPFAIGFGLGYLSRKKDLWIWRSTLFQYFLLIIPCMIYFVTHLWGHPSKVGSFNGNVLLYLTNTVAFACLLIAVSGKPNLASKFFSNRLFVALGKITYGLYIFHPLSVEIVMGEFGLTGTYSVLAASLALTTAVSMISYHFFEKRFLKMKPRRDSVQTASPELRPALSH